MFCIKRKFSLLLQLILLIIVILIILSVWHSTKINDKEPNSYDGIPNSPMNKNMNANYTKETILKPSFEKRPPQETCSLLTNEEVKNMQIQNIFQNSIGGNSIPRIVHYTYKSTQLPSQYESLLKHCLEINPDVTFIFWTDELAETFLQYLADSGIENAKKHLTILKTYDGIEKADVLRLMIMFYLGGIYMDLDTECRKSFTIGLKEIVNGNKTREQITCWLDQEQTLQSRVMWNREYSVMNNLMMCRPKHEFFNFMLTRLPVDDKKGFGMDKTGPFMHTRMFEEYLKSWYTSDKNIANYVELNSPDWFSPAVDNIDRLASWCGKAGNRNNFPHWKKIACDTQLEKFQSTIQEREKNAILSHKFMHLGYSFAQSWIRNTFNVCQYKVIMINIPLHKLSS